MAAALAVPASAQERPQIAVLDDAPVTVVGSGFGGGGRVAVRVSPLGRSAFGKTVTARANGGFSVIFRTRTLDRCVGYTITARGSDGSRATVRELIPPACAAPIAP